jgi:hypothetical protein
MNNEQYGRGECKHHHCDREEEERETEYQFLRERVVEILKLEWGSED